ncbi:PIR protein [Plasmodium yoelii]|uniref:PIR protein n=2 Tax=Plasmodium yoelii TaxID=5861 RepID=A0AAF0AZV2_PLAYO|nr:PIR protein [Plasmodium yoelii]WBY57072.1 PIR protein [Plasmodium yoelii yoelii]WBY57707.1 PIR protein [Plasmodium yoelii yoelii]VTZ78189.1 PIR protein [Plasmodium yoelii]|eukprot:XP_034493485.1 PIR protein [Plasmodium yoelii]
MNKEVCEKFKTVTTNLEYDSNTKNYKFKDNTDFKEYCTDDNCDNDLDNISAGCLFLFNEIFGNSTSFSFIAKGNTNIVEYIMIWLSYMLNFKKIEENDTIKNFYEAYINSDNRYITDINNVSGYKNYKDLIDKKEDLMSIYVKDMSKFYYVFTLLCMMYVEFDEERPNCYKFSEIANDFAKKYDELNENYNNGKDSPYNKLLSTLSNDYNNFKNKCNDPEFSNFPSLPTYSRRLVIKNTLISIGFIFIAVSIFLGIGYKYSLFGFRKRFQKQCLRERIKNIKKKLIINKLF